MNGLIITLKGNFKISRQIGKQLIQKNYGYLKFVSYVFELFIIN